LQEAWEEAGVSKGHIKGDMIGAYTYKKLQGNGTKLRCLVDVYYVDVESLDDQFPESDTRERRWVSKADAIKGKPEQQVFLGLEIADWRSPARHPRFEATFVAILGGFRNFRQTPP